MTEDHNQDGSDGVLTRRGLFGATLAVTSGFGLASMAGSAAAQQGNNLYLRDAYIGGSENRNEQIGRRGWLYFETDTGQIYYDDGGGWSALGGGVGSREPTVIDSTQSTTTDGSSVVYVDTSPSGTGEPITLTIGSANEENGGLLEIYDVGEAAGSNPITIENSDGEFVAELDVDRAYTELIYQAPRWLVKTSKGEGIWRTESATSIPEDGLLEDWSSGTLDAYGGDVSSFTVNSDDAIVGDNSVYTADTASILTDKYTFGPGVTFQARINTTHNGRPGILFGFQDQEGRNGNGYHVGAESAGSIRRYAIRKYVDGEVTTLQQEDGGASPAGEWRYDRVYWGPDGTIKYAVYDETETKVYQIVATDTEFGAGNFGWIGYGNTGTYRGDAFEILGEGDLIG